MTWEEMDFSPNVIAQIAKAGLESPSNIQKLVMEPLLQGKDVVAQSQSQDDRTCTLAMALLQKLSPSASTHKHCQALVICSERVNPPKVHEDFKSWFEDTPGLEAVLLTSVKDADSRTALSDDSRATLSDPNQAKQVVLTTLGPLMEALKTNLLSMKDIKTVIISMQAAELVDFDSFKQLLRQLSRDSQIVLMTGKILPHIEVIKNQNFRDNAAIRRADELTLQYSEHYHIPIPLSSQEDQQQEQQKGNSNLDKDGNNITLKDPKWDLLVEILTKNPIITHTVITTQSQSQTQALTSKLKEQKFNVVSVWSVADRDGAASQFNKPEPCIFVSEPTLMDGLDLDRVWFVINYDMPRRAHFYINSFGPFGRSGSRVLMINFCVMDDPGQKQTLEDIQTLYDITIPEFEQD